MTLTYHTLGPKPRQEHADRGVCHYCARPFPDDWTIKAISIVEDATGRSVTAFCTYCALHVMRSA